ncbi:MAG: hypothetical protein ACI93T_004313, partial [Porticoccaceae bacterium]
VAPIQVCHDAHCRARTAKVPVCNERSYKAIAV